MTPENHTLVRQLLKLVAVEDSVPRQLELIAAIQCIVGLIDGAEMSLAAARHSKSNAQPPGIANLPPYALAELMTEIGGGLPRAEGWDEMPAGGLENGSSGLRKPE